MNIQHISVGVLFAIFAFVAPTVSAATVSTLFSQPFAGDGGSALAGYLDTPKGGVALADGTIVIADTFNNLIRTVSADGTLGTLSGTGNFGKRDGAIANATWSWPEGIAKAGESTFFVADTGSNSIRRIRNGKVKTLPIAGLKQPAGIATDGTTLFIADTGNDRIVRVPVGGGTVTTLAKVNAPLKLVLVRKKLFVIESGKSRVLEVHSVTGGKRAVATGFTEPRALASVNGKLIVAAGPSGIENELWRVNIVTGTKRLLERRRETELLNTTSDLFVGTLNGADRLVQTQSGGSSVYTTALDGSDLQQLAGRHRFQDEDGAVGTGLVGRPSTFAVSHDGTKVYVGYAQGNKIGVYDVAARTFTALAGRLMDNYIEGVGLDARFSGIGAMAISNDDTTLYVADRNNQRIRTVNTVTGVTAYLTGAGITNLIDPASETGQIDASLDNGYQEGGPCADEYDRGEAGCAYFNRPAGIVLSSDDSTLYVADTGNARIRSIDVATGVTTLVAGSGNEGLRNGVGSAAWFKAPTSLALSADGTRLYVVDKGNNAIRRIRLSTGKVTTLAGNGNAGYREGAFAQARFSIPEHIAMGPDGNLYVAEAGSLRIRKLDLTAKTVSLVAGTGKRGLKNGTATATKWNVPKGLAFLGDDLLAADFFNDVLRLVAF